MKKKSSGQPEHSVRPSLLALAAVVNGEQVEEVAGIKTDYDRHLPEARKLQRSLVKGFVGDANLAYHNVNAGLAAVKAQHAQLLADAIPVAWDALDELPSIALALCFAVSEVRRLGAPTGETASTLAQARILRDILMTNADGAERAGLLKTGSVQKIRDADQTRDRYGDLLLLADLFQEHADSLRGSTPVKAKHLRDARTLHAELTRTLMPKGTHASARRSPELNEAIAARDALAALLSQRHSTLDKVGGWLWGRDVGEHVPALQSRRAQRKRTKKVPQPTPTG